MPMASVGIILSHLTLPAHSSLTIRAELSFACRLVLSCRGGVPWWLVLHFIEKGSGPQPSLINAALPLHTQVHVCMFPLQLGHEA